MGSAFLDSMNEIFEDRVRIGLDIGGASVKAVQMKRAARGWSMIKAGYQNILPVEQTGEELPEAGIIKALGTLWKEQKIRCRRVYLTISDPAVYSRQIIIPLLAEEELNKAVKWQAEKYAPFPIENTSVDYEFVGKDAGRPEKEREIVMVAAEGKIIEKYLSILKAVNLIPAAIDVTSLSVARCFLQGQKEGFERMIPIVDVGYQKTSMTIVKAHELMLVRTIPFGIKHLSSGASQEPAQKSAELIREIERSFAYCESKFSSEQEMGPLILCGGGVCVPGLGKSLQDRLGMEVLRGDPFEYFTATRRLTAARSENLGPCIMAAVGAAVSGF